MAKLGPDNNSTSYIYIYLSLFFSVSFSLSLSLSFSLTVISVSLSPFLSLSISLHLSAWWTFRPEKKYLAPPPPQIPIRCRHAPSLSAPPSLETPPPGIFNKSQTPPFLAPRTPPSPPRPGKKIKNIRDVHQVCHISQHLRLSDRDQARVFCHMSRVHCNIPNPSRQTEKMNEIASLERTQMWT